MYFIGEVLKLPILFFTKNPRFSFFHGNTFANKEKDCLSKWYT